MTKAIETTTVQDKQFFDFDLQGCQVITLEQLARTYKENDVMGQPLRGIYHYSLIEEIVKMANEQNYEVEIYDMFACKNKDRQAPGVVINPQIEALKGERAIEAHCSVECIPTFASRILTMTNSQLTSQYLTHRKEYRLASVLT